MSKDEELVTTDMDVKDFSQRFVRGDRWVRAEMAIGFSVPVAPGDDPVIAAYGLLDFVRQAQGGQITWTLGAELPRSAPASLPEIPASPAGLAASVVEEPPPAARRGRPTGSKNKPAEAAVPTTIPAKDLVAEASAKAAREAPNPEKAAAERRQRVQDHVEPTQAGPGTAGQAKSEARPASMPFPTKGQRRLKMEKGSDEWRRAMATMQNIASPNFKFTMSKDGLEAAAEAHPMEIPPGWWAKDGETSADKPAFTTPSGAKVDIKTGEVLAPAAAAKPDDDLPF